MTAYGVPRKEKAYLAKSSPSSAKYILPYQNPFTCALPLETSTNCSPRHQVLIVTIRSEIASCSEKAYPSLPIANAKNLLFLESEGSVVEFARERGWVVKDGRIYFPLQQGEDLRTEKEILVASGQVIENTIGYARELETIV